MIAVKGEAEQKPVELTITAFCQRMRVTDFEKNWVWRDSLGDAVAGTIRAMVSPRIAIAEILTTE